MRKNMFIRIISIILCTTMVVLVMTGCNDGTKTIECFSNDAVSQVIGLEYNHKLAKQAQARYGGEKFSFYSCDVESVDFSEQMKNIMREKGIKGFDIIYLTLWFFMMYFYFCLR